MRGGAALLALAAFLALAPAVAPALAQTTPSPAQGATVVTYTVPIQFSINTGGAVAANSTAQFNMTLPYTPGAGAEFYLSYRLADANGTLLADASGITIKVLDVKANTTVSTIALAAGSPAEAVVPLAAPRTDSLAVIVENTLAADVNANLTITVIDSAQFEVSLSHNAVQIPKGGSASVQVTIKQVSGPAGTLTLNAYIKGYPAGISTSVTPSRHSTSAGAIRTSTWTFTVSQTARPGDYTAVLEGTFIPQNLPGILSGQAQYTFAEVTFPIAVAAAGGFSLGSLMGFSLGLPAVALAIVILLVIIVAVFLFSK